MKLPSKKQWLQIFNILGKKERIAFFIFIGLFLTSSLFLLINFYLKNTEVKEAPGGTYTEGVVGFPRFINPVYAQSSDVDRDLVELIFSGIMKYDDQGQLVYDLAQSIEEKDDGETYVVKLKENVFWHDNEPLTTNDIVFTIKTIQNADYKSPLRGNYLGIDVVKINDYTLHFKLKNVYSGFLERLTFKIIPEHIWQDI